MRAVDTNVLVRLLTRDDARQLRIAEAFVAPGAWVSHLVLVETVWVLASVYKRGPSEIATAVGMLLSHENVALQDPDVVATALADYLAKPAAGFSDCLVLAVARKAGHPPLGTFDRNLAKLDGARRLSG